jgi:methylmalonyl-CoA mutase
MQRQGVQRIFFAGTPLAEMADWIKQTYGSSQKKHISAKSTETRLSDRDLAELLTEAEAGIKHSTFNVQLSARVVGLTGPGGAGKTTLIDELALRFLKLRPRGRLAILSHDPSLNGNGALLGDRASMVNAQDDRVFMRSLATRGKAGGVSSATLDSLQILRHAAFDLVLVESTGIGQQDVPFARNLVDKQVLVLSPDYGARLQLHKIAMLEAADIVVVNKSDQSGARTAMSELEQRLALNDRGQKLVATVAKRHRDSGVDEMFTELMS